MCTAVVFLLLHSTAVRQWCIRYTYILYCRTRHSHNSSYTYTPTVRRHWTPETCEFKSPSLLLFVCAVQLYCVLLCNCTYTVSGWVGCWWVEGDIAVQLYGYCTVLLLLSPAAARSLGPSRRRSLAATVARASIAAVVDRPPSTDRSLARSPACRRSSAVDRPPPLPSLGWPLAAVVARPPSPARSLARPPSFVRSTAVARP